MKLKNFFSLVELLIVITILIILISLLLPALRNSYETSNLIICKNNLKENSIFHQVQMDNNNNLLVASMYYNATGSHIFWFQAQSQNPHGIMGGITDNLSTSPYEHQTFLCPSSPATPGVKGTYGVNTFNEYYLSGDYALIRLRYNLSSTAMTDYFTRRPKITDVNSPENLVWMFDKAYSQKINAMTKFHEPPDELMYTNGLHKGGRVFTYMDGHANFHDEDYLYTHVPFSVRPGPLGNGSFYDKMDPLNGDYIVDVPHN